MSSKSSQGFTLIEVVLAIAVGLIIIAGVSVGYSYAKRAAILDNQRKNMAAIKTYVEQAIASQQADPAGATAAIEAETGITNLIPPGITSQQLAALAASLPSLKTDPYTGTARVTDQNNYNDCFSNGASSCIAADSYNPNSTNNCNISDGSTFTSTSDLGVGWNQNAGSGVFYLGSCNSYNDQVTLTLADGSTRSFRGWFVVETDPDGNLVAAEGGTDTVAAAPQPA